MATEVLGFTGKFYSLWNVTDASIHNELFDQTITRYSRVRKVSNKLTIAQKKYPNAPVLDILDGRTHGFTHYGERIFNSVDRFRFGKYTGSLIENHIDDIQYIRWYYGNIYDEHKKYVNNILINAGCQETKETIKIGGFKVTKKEIILPEELKNIKEMTEASNNINTTVEIKHWLNEKGEYIGENKNIIYVFENFKECYYGGFTYYKPAINGVGKNVKNKSIKINNYTTNIDNHGKLFINISSFEVIK